METLNTITLTSALVFVLICSWVGSFFVVAVFSQWLYDSLKSGKPKNPKPWRTD